MSLLSGIKDMITEPNNKTICGLKVVGIYGALHGYGLAAYDVLVQHAHFDLMTYGGGFGALMTGLGVALQMKKDTPQ